MPEKGKFSNNAKTWSLGNWEDASDIGRSRNIREGADFVNVGGTAYLDR